jgi:hypothetical protein
MGRQVVKSYLPMTIRMRESDGVDYCGLVLFRLVAPPLQPRVMGPCLLWDAWFPSHLPLVETGHT